MKVLLLHASLGAGHKRAAEALLEVLRQRNIETEIQDLLVFLPHTVARFYSRMYTFMINDARWLWRYVYALVDQPRSDYAPAKSRLQRWQFRSLSEYLGKQGFTHILSTHFTPSALLTDWKAKGRINGKIFSVITDYVAHRCWMRGGLDHYFIASDTVCNQLQKAGVSAERITVSGIPISPAFSDAESREQARKKWECLPEDTLLLVLCSALNLQKTLAVLREIGELSGKLRFLVSTGTDPSKERQVKDVFQNDTRYTIFGFSPGIAQMMRAADLILTKPGGLIVSEALAMGKPQILFPPIPGQEEANAEYSVTRGAAVSIPEKRGAIKSALEDLLSHPARLQSMNRAAACAGKPHAARTIIDVALRAG